MKRKPTSPREEPEPVANLGLEGLPPTDGFGLSLDELSETFTSLLTGGADPYEPAPPPADAVVDEFPLDDPELDSEPTGDEPSGPVVDACEISPRTILEAMLFVGHPTNEPLTAKYVASLMRGVRPREIDELVEELNAQYEDENCAYRIESIDAGYRITLRPELNGVRDRFYGRVREAKLSQQAIDVLAVVAYNQPLTRPEIDKLRSAASGAVLSQLVRRGLLRVERPDKKPREPIFYTTDRFLELFGLSSLDDLPKSHDFERSL